MKTTQHLPKIFSWGLNPPAPSKRSDKKITVNTRMEEQDHETSSEGKDYSHDIVVERLRRMLP